MSEKSWLDSLKQHVSEKPIILLSMTAKEYATLVESKNGLSEFSFTRNHDNFSGDYSSKIILYCFSDKNINFHLGYVSSCRTVSTLDTALKIIRGFQTNIGNIKELESILCNNKKQCRYIKNSIVNNKSSISISKKSSVYLIERLADFESNTNGLKQLSHVIPKKESFKKNIRIQKDAICLALKIANIQTSSLAESITTYGDSKTSLESIPIRECSVIEHDARQIQGYKLTNSSVTGVANFEGKDGFLTVYTANIRNLEECFGVDLIYFNETMNSIAMVQYKMLNYEGSQDGEDWVYRPDRNIGSELKRMKNLNKFSISDDTDYRINPNFLFLKFVKNDATSSHGSIIIMLDHFEKYIKSGDSHGPLGGIRVSYNSFRGKYLRETGFIDLIRSGYIGSYPNITNALHMLIKKIIGGNRSLVLAIKRAATEDLT